MVAVEWWWPSYPYLTFKRSFLFFYETLNFKKKAHAPHTWFRIVFFYIPPSPMRYKSALGWFWHNVFDKRLSLVRPQFCEFTVVHQYFVALRVHNVQLRLFHKLTRSHTTPKPRVAAAMRKLTTLQAHRLMKSEAVRQMEDNNETSLVHNIPMPDDISVDVIARYLPLPRATCACCVPRVSPTTQLLPSEWMCTDPPVPMMGGGGVV